MATVARNRIEKVLPQISGGEFFSLGGHFIGKAASAEDVCRFVRFWVDRRLGKMTVDGKHGRYRLHSNEWVEFTLA